jgi:drug/metabolite transporter (DMT)-like permease
MSTPDDAWHTGMSARAPALWCLLAAMLFGASTPAAKALLGPMGPLLLSGVLYLGAAIAVLPWALRHARVLRRIDRSNLLRLLGAVFFGGMLGPVLLLWGLSLAPAASVSLWLTLETVATAILARLFFREHLHGYAWLAVGLIVLGSAAMAPGSLQGGLAALLVALACIAWGLDNNFTAVIDGVTPAQTTFLKGLAAGSVNVTLGVLLEPNAASDQAILGALALGALAYGLSLILYISGAQQLGATRSQLFFSTAPSWGVALSWLWLAEPIQPSQCIAAGLIAAALWLLHRERHAHEHAHAAIAHTHWHRHDDDHHAHDHRPRMKPRGWHTHEHTHEPEVHTHVHRPDVHHRHNH